MLTREECEELGRRILGLTSAPHAEVRISSGVESSTAFARGDARVAEERANLTVGLTVDFGGRRSAVLTTRLDQDDLAAIVQDVEAAARQQISPAESDPFLGPQQYPASPQLCFDSVPEAMGADGRAAVFRLATDATEAAGLVAAGDVDLSLSARAIINTQGLFTYERETFGEFSLTARTRDGRGSGWAWAGHEDWARVDVGAAAARAVALAERSARPVAIEPGRYTVILEPAAVEALLGPAIGWMRADHADQGWTVYSKEPVGTNKIGLRMMDRRLSVVSDPWDPEMPSSVIGPGGAPVTKVAWFEAGVLTNLEYTRSYARKMGHPPVFKSAGVRLAASGPPTSLEEMIASTERGVWVNRLSNIGTANIRTLLLTGTTRDGTFLIENGKITKAIRNFRFTDSPFFVLNKLEAWGEPVRASPGMVAPRLKLRDFEFTSLTDAV